VKKIAVTFIKDGMAIAHAEGEFPLKHGEGLVHWSGNLEPHLFREFRGLTRLNPIKADRFAGTLSKIAEISGLDVDVQVSGDWLE
jgi:hypothetical protein